MNALLVSYQGDLFFPPQTFYSLIFFSDDSVLKIYFFDARLCKRGFIFIQIITNANFFL